MILLDFSSLAIITLMSDLKGQRDVEIDPKVCRNIWLRAILEYRKKYHKRFGEIVLATDDKTYWRSRILPYYKGTRKKQKEQSDIDWKMVSECVKTVSDEISRFMPYPVIKAQDAEADDVIAVMAEWSQENDVDQSGVFDTPKDTIIISADGDFVQLKKFKNIKQFSPMTQKEVKADRPLSEFCLDHILRGDSTDAVPNINSHDNFFYEKDVNGVTTRQKPVTAKIFDHYNAQWKTGEITNWLLPEHEERFERNRNLVMFDCIPDDVKQNVIEAYKKQCGKGRGKMLPYFQAAKLTNLLPEIHDF